MGKRGLHALWVLGLCLGWSLGFAVLAGADGGDKTAVLSNLTAQLYGYIRLDAAYDTARIFPGNYALWVKSAYLNRSDDAQLDLTANQTRLGLNLTGPEVAGAKSSGKLEFDFYGGGVENKSNPMMRHAYMELNWAASDSDPGGPDLGYRLAALHRAPPISWSAPWPARSGTAARNCA